MLYDKLRIDFISGKGGDGLVSFARAGRTMGKNGKVYYPQKGKPDGGNGGRGGDIYIEGSNDLYDLSSFVLEKKYTAEDGGRGFPGNKLAKAGKDLVIKVPVVTVIYDIKGNILLEIKKHGEKKLLLKGGAGGLGNHHFKEGQIGTLKVHTQGEKGQSLKGFIELRLESDIIFIGLPNAGKSSMLNLLTNADVKIAGYAFTTIQPQLGIMQDSIKLMDLPGLTEGTAEGKGLGRRFSKHTLSAKLIAHFISLESKNLEDDYKLIRNELASFSEELLNKKEIVILTKSDLYSNEEIERKTSILKKYDIEVIITSVYNNKRLDHVKNRFRDVHN